MDPTTYAAYNNDIHERLKSSSGGIFILLSKYILSIGGVTYGVGMTGDCRVAEFIRVSEAQEIPKLLSSKYLQAKLNNTYRSVKDDLNSGIPVLFTGTGCQINGLKTFLQRHYPKLYCVDVVCHGIPSPKLWGKYLNWIEHKHRLKIKEVNFRCKDAGWSDYGIELIADGDKKIFTSRKIDSYMQMFLSDLSLRPSCYECAAKQYKMSDMTIADFWGVERVVPDVNDNKGVSMVIIRTAQGESLFTTIKNSRIFLSRTR